MLLYCRVSGNHAEYFYQLKTEINRPVGCAAGHVATTRGARENQGCPRIHVSAGKCLADGWLIVNTDSAELSVVFRRSKKVRKAIKVGRTAVRIFLGQGGGNIDTLSQGVLGARREPQQHQRN